MSYEGKVNTAELHFESSFQGYPTCQSFFLHFRWPGGRWPGDRWHEKTIGKWGIPEKSFKNVAQLCWLYLRRTSQSKVMTDFHFCGNRILHCEWVRSSSRSDIWAKFQNFCFVIWSQFRPSPKSQKMGDNRKLSRSSYIFKCPKARQGRW